MKKYGSYSFVLFAGALAACSPSMTDTARQEQRSCEPLFGSWFSYTAEQRASSEHPRGEEHILSFNLEGEVFREEGSSDVGEKGAFIQRGCEVELIFAGRSTTYEILKLDNYNMSLRNRETGKVEEFYSRNE